MYSLKIIFVRPENSLDKLELDWQVLPTVSATIWFNYLIKAAQIKEAKFFPRFTGFVSQHKSFSMIKDKLNRAIEMINKEVYAYKISERATDSFSQEFANKIHHHFELIVGSVETPKIYYKNFSAAGRKAALQLNHCIHDMEALTRAQNNKSNQNSMVDTAAALIIEALHIPRYILPEAFNTDFDMSTDFGDMVLHYAQIGKTWWEVFIDQDNEIFNEAVLPLNCLTGEFDIFFFKYQMNEKINSDFKNFLLKRNLDPNDVNLKLGYLKVAKMIKNPDLSETQYRKLISDYLELSEIKLFKDAQQIDSILLDSNLY